MDALIARLALVAALLFPVPARAQGEDDGEEARVLFDRAVEELRRGHFPSARDLLMRSLELFPTAGTAFNLALALHGTGESVAAVALLERLSSGEYGALADEERAQVTDLLARARADLARLSVSVRGPPTARVRVDGAEAGQALPSEPLELTLDAGRHVVDARATDYRAADEVVELARGESRSITLALEPVPASPAGPQGDEATLWESPLTWIILGVVIAGGAAAVYFATRDRTADPVDDPVFPIGEVLRW